MKLSVSLPDEDVATLDEFAGATGLRSRSAVVQYAIGLLRRTELESDYEAAWTEWEESGDSEAWDVTAADGPGDVAR